MKIEIIDWWNIDTSNWSEKEKFELGDWLLNY